VPQYFASNQAAIGVEVTGVTLDHISWDSMEGGDNTAEDKPVFPGGMAPQAQLTSIPKRSPLTVTRLWTPALVNEYKALDSLSGQASTTATYSLLEPNGKPTGFVITYTGVLLSVDRPAYKSGPGGEEVFLTLMIGLNGPIA
jgi:hypothetical protein